MIITSKILLKKFKAHINLSKYADKILRILIILQECINEREANKKKKLFLQFVCQIWRRMFAMYSKSAKLISK